jgi:hypothetical protein
MLNSMAALTVVREAAQREILSARPDAPVVPDVPRRASRARTYRTRVALARASSPVWPTASHRPIGRRPTEPRRRAEQASRLLEMRGEAVTWEE